jgi:putative ABC transport system permease protein
MGMEYLSRMTRAGRTALRLLLRERRFSLTILLSLSIGIGSAAATFSAYEALFLRALPGIDGANRVLALATEIRGNSLLLPVSYPNYRDLQDQSTSFENLAAAQAIQVALADHGESEQVRGEMVTANYFATLGVKASRGRLFLPHEDRFPGGAAVIVLSDGLWRRRFGADPEILGRSVNINGHPCAVVGIAGTGFRGVDLLSRAELWVPIAMYRQVSAAPELFLDRGDQTLQVFGRRKPSVSARHSASEIEGLSARLAQAFPADNRDQRIVVQPLSAARIRPKSRAVLLHVSVILVGMGSLLLLVTCSNVAGLALVRMLGRLDELALRSSLGASHGQLWREALVEGLPFVILALPLGFAATRAEIWLLWKFRPPFLPADLLLQPLDGRVLGVLLLASLAGSLLLWMAPALQIRHLDPARTIHQRTQGHLGSDHPFSLRRLIVVIEIGLSFVAISGATYSLVHLRELRQVNPGFESSQLITVTFDLHGLGLKPSAAKEVEERIRECVSTSPGMERVAYASDPLLGGAQWMHGVVIQGRNDPPIMMGSSLVEPTYFETVGIPVRSGRGFQLHDDAEGPPVAIVNATMADRLWPGRSPLHEHLLLDNAEGPLEVVGIVQDSMLSGIDEVPHPFLYLPLAQRASGRLALEARVTGDPRRYLEAIERKVREVAPGLPVRVEAVSATLDRTLWWPQALAGLLTLLSALTLFVAGTGIYGITAYVSGQRKSEIGLRLALGARRQSILGLVVKEGLQVLAAGTVLGGIAAVGFSRFVANSWSSLSMLSLLTGSEILLLIVTLLAELAPALAAIRTDPSTALKGAG